MSYGFRLFPARSDRIERVLQPIQSESVSATMWTTRASECLEATLLIRFGLQICWAIS